MSASSRSRRSDPMGKKIPQNPKYKNVKATVDTGASLTKYMNKIEDIRQNYKFRKNEIFKRMKITTFVQLVLQVAQVNSDELMDSIPETPMHHNGAGDRPDTSDIEVANVQRNISPVPSLAVTEGDYGGAPSARDTSRSTLQSVAAGVGELDINDPPPAPTNRFVDAGCPYLLLDVRENDEYEMSHIITANSYPKAILSRATNYESKEMLAYKNKPGKIIVIYDEDERIGHTVATTLVQRGYDNLFMISGGLKVAVKMFPEGLHTGTLPISVTGHKPKQVLPASQKYFTLDDTNAIEMYLDTALQDNSIGSRLSQAGGSRMSGGRSTTRSTASAASSASYVTDRPAFK